MGFPRSTIPRTHLPASLRVYRAVFVRIHGLVRDWPKYYLARLQRTEGPVVLQLRNGLQFAVRPFTIDLDVLDEVVHKGVYTFCDWTLPTSPNIVDIGAHIGAFSVLASQLWPSASIFAFEPQEDNFRLLQQNLCLNQCTRVQAFQLAVAGQSGPRNLRVSLTNTGGHALESSSEGASIVNAVSLSEFMGKYPIDTVHFLKMDCEGSEYEILKNLPNDLFARIERLAVEFHRNEALSSEEGAIWLSDLLQARGYKLLQHVSDEARMLYAWRTVTH